jgi:hypothetical protein
MAIFLSKDGQNFVYKCPRCEAIHREPVDPERNPRPFDFIYSCQCGRRIDFDWDIVWAAQDSYTRAKAGRS